MQDNQPPLTNTEKAYPSQNIDQSFLLARQIDRVNYSLTQQDSSFFAGVEALESMMSPYRDVVYETKLKEINAVIEKLLRKIRKRNVPVSGQLESRILFFRSSRKYRALIELIYRQNFFPIEDTSYTQE